MVNYFPTHLALGRAFCNRKEEMKWLLYNIENVNPVLIRSPRRYGKTSLALNAFSKIKWPYAHIDFYKALDEEDIEKTILNGHGLAALPIFDLHLVNCEVNSFPVLPWRVRHLVRSPVVRML